MPLEERRRPSGATGAPPDHRANRFLAALDLDDFALLEPYLEAVILPRDTVLYEPGDPIRYTYFPHDAIVSLVDVMKDGRLAEVAMFGREGLFGLLSAFVSREAFGRYVVQIPGSASRVALDRMHAAIQARPALQRQVLAYNEALLAQAYHTVACNAVHPVEARCCRWLLSTHDRLDEDALPLTHEFLAEMLGVQRSTVSTVLRGLQTAGLIEQRRGGIAVIDSTGLEHAACECYRKIRSRFDKLLPGTFSEPAHDCLATLKQPMPLATTRGKAQR
ncbi:Crp/Fnr family transcriptional regulator [Microvirga sp. BT688]|uniref:Crp/Fnr family transcriptional regulator n=1 Tax=Microvirga sp. TaxID=1873136 RepID=UPI0016898784|nr:Crp/Fnr family transcriptional regulator [Microvirga sp.]MBD2750918.1 Crp/Fnr family transcriptional regulator [Microvirga sp.]